MKAQKFQREWVPSCFLLAHEEGRVWSTIRYSPRHIQRSADVTYLSSVKIYGRNPTQPIWSADSEPLHLDSVFAIDSSRIAAELGETRLLHYGEVYNRAPEMPPPTPNISMPAHIHYRSSDGGMNGHIASFFIFGAPRSIERGEYYYENFPAARIDDQHSLSVFIINPFLRPTTYSVSLVSRARGVWHSPEATIRGKGVVEWKSTDSDFPGAPDPLGVIVRTELKTSAFFASRDRSGLMLGLDHGHPFLSHVLDHRP